MEQYSSKPIEVGCRVLVYGAPESIVNNRFGVTREHIPIGTLCIDAISKTMFNSTVDAWGVEFDDAVHNAHSRTNQLGIATKNLIRIDDYEPDAIDETIISMYETGDLIREVKKIFGRV